MKIDKLSYILLATALCGCTTDTTEDTGTPKTGTDIILRASIGDDGQTRADMTEDGLRFSFSAEDKDRIGLYLNYPAKDWTDQNLCFEAESTLTKDWVGFKQISSSSFDIQEGLKAYAYYPYAQAEAQVSGSTENPSEDTRAAVSANWTGTRNLEVPASQEQVAAGDFSNLAKYYVLAAVPTTVFNDTDNIPTVELNFSGVFALLRIRLVNGSDSEVTITKVDFETAQGQELTGLYTVDLTADPKFANTDYTSTAIEGKTDNKVSVTLTTPATIAAGSDSYIYAVVHPMIVSYCTITAWTDDGYKFVERKTFNDNTTVSLQRDIRRTFRCTMSDSNKQSVTAPEQDGDYYLIDSYEDMLWVSENATDATKKYKMTKDIDMAGKVYTPIGFGTNYAEGAKAQEFAGEFDGGGHTISNVTVNPAYHTCVGIFGATKSGAVIRNLHVENLTYESDLPSEKAGQRKWIGGLIGYALPGTTVSDVTLKNISLTAHGTKENASNAYRLGGVIGLMELGSEDVSHYTNITADGITLTGGCSLGGFTGTMQQNAEITDCSVKNITIRHKDQYSYAGDGYYPNTGGYVYSSSYFAGDVNKGTINITCTGELVGGTNSREDLDELGYMDKTTWDIQPYVGELSDKATVTLNGEQLKRKVEVTTPQALAATLASRGGEVVIAADLDMVSAGGGKSR